MTYESWILQLTAFLMVNGHISWNDATMYLSMLPLRQIWNDYQFNMGVMPV